MFLAHVGSFVPADRAVIGPVDRIITRINSVDCVLDGMSSFANDLSQVRELCMSSLACKFSCFYF